jgi:hypothetical protein
MCKDALSISLAVLKADQINITLSTSTHPNSSSQSRDFGTRVLSDTDGDKFGCVFRGGKLLPSVSIGAYGNRELPAWFSLE